MTFGAGMNGMKFWPLAIWFFFMYGSVMVYQGLWAGPFFHDILGWDKAAYGLVLTFIGIGMIIGCPTAGYISDKILKSRKKVLIVGTVVYTITWAIIWMSPKSGLEKHVTRMLFQRSNDHSVFLRGEGFTTFCGWPFKNALIFSMHILAHSAVVSSVK